MTQAMEPINAVLEKIVAKSLRQTASAEAPLVAWPLACGDAVAKRTRAVEYANGILRVEVPDFGWRTELKAMARQYLAILNRYVSDDIKRIEFIVGSSRHP